MSAVTPTWTYLESLRLAREVLQRMNSEKPAEHLCATLEDIDARIAAVSKALECPHLRLQKES